MKVDKSEIPVALFVFNRHEQLAKTLDCLRKNGLPKLYVFADGSRDKDDESDIKKVRAIIDAIDWVNVEKSYQKKNKGLSKSIQDGLDYVFTNHDKAIVIEDDICVAPQFYSYMSACLNEYEDSREIGGVTGLRYPFYKKNLNSDPYDVFIAPRFSSWGWGSWKRQWETLSFDGEALVKELRACNVRLDAGGSDLPYAINEIESGNLSGYWDVSFYMNMLLHKQYFVWPKQNFVINTGITEGSHASGAPEPPWQLRWENKNLTGGEWRLPKRIAENDKILKDFLNFFEPSNLIGTSLRQGVGQKLKRIKLR